MTDIDKALKNRIMAILVFLIGLDVTISIAAFFFPDLWFTVFHGVDYVDPQGFLRRCGANWTAFALFQVIALFKWRKKPYWLLIVAGIRLSDIFTDWTYLVFCNDITWFGRISLFVVSPCNLLIGWYLIRSWLKIRSGSEARVS